jgi:hypothetical protein
MKIYPKGSKVWSEQLGICPTPADIQKKYEEGFSGIYEIPGEKERFNEVALETGGYVNLEDAAAAFGWAGSFANQLIAPFVYVLEAYPGCWPGKSQPVGDCVSRSNTNAILGTLTGEVVSGMPDEVTGFLETFPKISDVGISNGALASEPVYWWRGSNSHGWMCDRSATVSIQNTGAVLRQDFPEININLSTYTKANIEKYGRTPPPENVAKHLSNNRIRTAARVSTFDAIRDSLAQGRFIHSCGSEGFSNTRDARGVSVRRSSWAHAMAYIGADDRPEIVKMYNSPLVLILNSWGNWNSGPREIFDSAKYVPSDKKALWTSLGIVSSTTGNILIPNGSFWAKWTDIQRRQCFAFAGLSGWRMKPIESWGLNLIG